MQVHSRNPVFGSLSYWFRGFKLLFKNNVMTNNVLFQLDICTWLVYSGYSYQIWVTLEWLCFGFSQVQLGLGSHYAEAGVCANSALSDLHNVGVWNYPVGTNANSFIKPSVPCEEEFSTGIRDVPSRAFSFRHSAHNLWWKNNAFTVSKTLGLLVIFSDGILYQSQM